MQDKKRHLIQGAATLATNLHLQNFFTGNIYKGPTKGICVPGLNCYSCPGAAGACPIGALQAVLGGRKQNVSYYVVGGILLFGVLLGRLVCGFLCPFGFLQDLLHKLRTPKLHVPQRLDKPLRSGKFVTLAAVLVLPVLWVDAYGVGTPAFCKLLCPAGTLEGGIPLLLANPALRSAAGFLFSWKVLVLVLVLAASVLLYRPFCKYLCPLGAIYGLLNKYSLYQMRVDEAACVHCGKCTAACGMGVDVLKDINSAECIRCGRCKTVCPVGAVHSSYGLHIRPVVEKPNNVK